ncbi:MAG: hypothetical protein P1U46_02895 [Patescibacteria group bacterium]|nr:hypothetical protein [Patescibacteria group bacterium]
MIKNNELNEVLEYANKNNISDIHIVTNKTIYYRDNSGDIITID